MRRPFRDVVLSWMALGCSGGTEPNDSRVDIRLTPAVTTLMANDTTRARAYDRLGSLYPVPAVTWRSGNPAVAEVDGAGLVYARGPGSTTITATVGTLSGSVDISVAGTLHRQAIVASETWSSTGNPHVVRGRLAVSAPGGATVTIEGGVTVVFEDSAGLTFGGNGNGSLRAQGTTSTPITMRGVAAPPVAGAWVGLTFRGTTQPELRHVVLRGCGGTRNDEQPRACLVLGHRIFVAERTSVLFDNVTVEDAAGTGIVLQGGARFAAGSATLSVRNVRGHVATLPAGAAVGFPQGGTFTGNDSNVVRIAGDTIRESATWQTAGLSWSVTERVSIEGPGSPVLTLPAGSSLRFAFGGGFAVGRNAPGGLHVGATGGAPVTLSSTEPNGWAGILFFPLALPSSITETVLENCGSYNDSGYGQGCVFVIGNFFGVAPAPVFRNITIRRAVETGISLIGGGRIGESSGGIVITETRGSPGLPFSIYHGDVASIPPGQYTGNGLDGIWVLRAEITRSQTWRNHGVPYMIREGLGIAHVANPMLTLEPGVVFRFAPATFLVIGRGAPGGIRAIGAEGSPIVLTGDFDSPGAWMGVHIGESAASTTMFDRAIVENAGGDDGQISAAFRIAEDHGEIIRRTLVRRSAGCGITRMTGTGWSTDFTAAHLENVFESNAGPNQCGP